MDFLWTDVCRNAFAQFRMGVSQINVHQHRFSPTARNVACPFCAEEKETSFKILLECPVYVLLRHKHLPDKLVPMIIVNPSRPFTMWLNS